MLFEVDCPENFGPGVLVNKEAICKLLGHSRPRDSKSKWLNMVNLKF